jgi:putative oxidoreductase
MSYYCGKFIQMTKMSTIMNWTARIVAAIILLQTLYFKFSASEESVYIFTTVGMEPWGRIGVGVLELIAAAMLLANRTVWMGAGLSAGLMAGAIMMHLTMLGISVKNDGGYLFFLAVVVLVCSLIVLILNRKKITLIFRSALNLN